MKVPKITKSAIMGYGVVFTAFLYSMEVRANLIAASRSAMCAYDGRSTVKLITPAEGRPVPASNVFCGGDNKHGQHDVPPEVVNPVQLVAGISYFCALFPALANATTGLLLVRCWGGAPPLNSLIQKIPVVVDQNPVIRISSGPYHVCALYQGGFSLGVECWGREDEKQSPAPSDIENPSGVFAGDGYTVVLHKNATKFRVFGVLGKERAKKEYDAPPGISGTGLSCRPSPDKNRGVECWSNRPGRLAPEILIAGLTHTCRLGPREGLSCLNNSTGDRLPFPGILHNVRDFAYVDRLLCALHDPGITCFDLVQGIQVPGPMEKLRFGPYMVSLSHAGILGFIESLSLSVYIFDKAFLEGIQRQLVREQNDIVALFIANGLRNYLQKFGYGVLRREYVNRALAMLGKPPHEPVFNSLREFNFRYGRLIPQFKKTAAEMLLEALLTMRNLLDFNKKAKLDKLISRLVDAPTEGGLRAADFAALREFLMDPKIMNYGYLCGRVNMALDLVNYLEG